MWLSNSSCGEIVQATWNHANGAEPNREILEKFEKCGKDLGWWNQNIFQSVRQGLIKKKKLLLQAENEAMTSGLNARVRELNSEISLLLDREARIWAQQSRIQWASQGDKNTKYFHSKATKWSRKKIKFMEFVMNRNLGGSIKMRFPKL